MAPRPESPVLHITAPPFMPPFDGADGLSADALADRLIVTIDLWSVGEGTALDDEERLYRQLAIEMLARVAFMHDNDLDAALAIVTPHVKLQLEHFSDPDAYDEAERFVIEREAC